MFAEKFDFLMDITNTKNKFLADLINVDASYISRLRKGTRKISDKQRFFAQFSSHFAENLKTDYQKKAFCSFMGISEFPEFENAVADLILNCLTEKDAVKKEPKNAMANMLNMFLMPSVTMPQVQRQTEEKQKEQLYYYGKKGKQDAVIRFLTNVLNTQTPQTLLLFSDENMEWLYEDKDYSKQWATLLMNVLMKGNKIKIIHSTGRDMNELFEAVAKWIPVYASGMIEPYYYPKLKDGIFQHTFFIAPKTNEAIVSSSVKQNTEDMLHFYVNDKFAIKSLIEEYENYFQLCKPLMQIGNIYSTEKTKKLFDEFSKPLTKTIVLRPFLPIATMPKKLINQIAKKYNCERIVEIQKTGLNFIKKNTDTTEIITKTDDRNFSYATCLGVDEITYTKVEYDEHLKNTKKIAENHSNYKILMQNNNAFDNMVLYYKEDYGVLMLKLELPCTTFLIQEPNMVAAFGDYLNEQVALLEEKNLSYLHLNDNLISL